MKNHEIFPLPEREFEHLPARVLAAAEAGRRSRSIEITTATYHGELLDSLDDNAADRLETDFRSKDVDISEYFDDSTCRAIENGYGRFQRTFEALPKDSIALRHLSGLFPYGERRYDVLDYEEKEYASGRTYDSITGFARTPTPAEYLIILRGLLYRAESAKHGLEKYSSESIKGMRRYLSSQDYLNGSTFDHRLKNIGVTIVDPLTMHLDNSGNASGLYGTSKDTIVISSDTSDIVGTFTHELLHQLSGKRRLEKTYNGSHDLQMRALMEDVNIVPNTRVIPQRIGVSIGWPKLRFDWLNEAVTSRLEEEIGESIVDRGSSKIVQRILTAKWSSGRAYPSEQALMDQILTSGKESIDFSLLAKAYFEDDDPNDPERLTHWRAFTHALSAAYSPGFLVDMDNVVKSQGVGAAQESLRSYF